MLFTSAFLLPDNTPTSTEGQASSTTTASVSKPAQLTEQQLHGKTLFTNNCAQCHAATNEVVVGPGLAGVLARTPGETWLTKWIRNSQAVVASGDP